ncbi:MAG: chromosomal replication initiator protein DnaA [Clostridiales bacterium]|nr:chromosomal replication initiator protein DnaA [Clostridiales bacterium]
MCMNTLDPWKRVLGLLEKQVNPISFNTWFRSIEVLSVGNLRMVLGTKDYTGVQVLRQRYFQTLSEAVREVYGQEYDLVILNVNEPIPPEITEPSTGNSDLNSRYTFDTFVVGESNRFAHAASLAVAELPGDAYNPLFLYGGVGLGKTHLMNAIGNYMEEENPSSKVLYITSERFTNEVIEAIQNRKTQELRDRLRGVDVLMVDDIQFIAGKTSTQEEFFHTFNHLHSGGKQIIISSDRPPKDISALEERLRSRFEWGLIADIQRPDFETRAAILRRKASIDHLNVPDEVITFIAEKVESNIRELEGSLIRVNAKASLAGQAITIEMAQDALKNLVTIRDMKRITPELIMEVVADYYRVEKDDLIGQRRNREITFPRQVAMYLIREMTGISTTRIGKLFGGRDHTTVLHGCDKIARELKEQSRLPSTLDDLRNEIRKR